MRFSGSIPLFALLGAFNLPAQESASANSAVRAGKPEGGAVLIHRADALRNRRPNGPGGLWPVLSTPEARMNYLEITGPTAPHYHPDADHRLYLLEGNLVVVTGATTNLAIPGDLIIIPKGATHFYDVPRKGDRALLLTFDAPPYDPRKTVNIKKVEAGDK